jgi:hypothetical protein
LPRPAQKTPDPRARRRRGLGLSPAADLSQVRSPNMPRLDIEAQRLVPGLGVCIIRIEPERQLAFLRGCEGGRHPRRLVLKPARAPPQKQNPANGTRAGRQPGNVRAGSLASPVEWVLGLPLGSWIYERC